MGRGCKKVLTWIIMESSIWGLTFYLQAFSKTETFVPGGRCEIAPAGDFLSKNHFFSNWLRYLSGAARYSNRSDWKLKLSSQVNHIYQLDAAFIDWMVITLRKKPLNLMGTDKPARFIKGNCQRAVSRSDL